MARIKNNITKSGASLLNERTRFYNNQNQQIRQPYIPNGYNIDHLITTTTDSNNVVRSTFAYNDENTINFNDLKYFNLKEYFDDNPNERNTLSQQLATPSTFHTLNINTNTLGNHDQRETLEKFLKKGNSIEVKFNAFNDREHIENSLDNQDFIKGEGKYSFLDTNLYEETSVEIELEVPADALLEYTAKMQSQDGTSLGVYETASYTKSPYNFRKNFPTNIPRKNSPFLMYNFDKKCFESRGYYARTGGNANQFEGFADSLVEDIEIIPELDFLTVTANNQILGFKVVNNNASNTSLFQTKIADNLKNHHFALTNTPINHLDGEEKRNDNYNYLTLPTMQFGFPHFPTFHTFEDNLISMKKFLNKNLIVDRVTVDLNVKLQAEISNNPNDFEEEDLDIWDGLNFSLNYFILNDSKNKKDLGLNFLSLNPQQYFKDFEIDNPPDEFLFLSQFNTVKHFTTKLIDNLNPGTVLNTFQASKQNLKIHRKLWGNLWGEEGDLNRNSLGVTDMRNRIDEIAFNKNIVSFGNVLFHASNPEFIDSITNKKPVYKSDKLVRFQQMKNNNDLVIDTISDNILKSDQINEKSDLNAENIFLDFEDKIKINSYVKKAGSYPRYLNANNLNYQFEIKSTLNSTQQYSLIGSEPNLLTGENILSEMTYNHTRNMLNNRLDGKDLINSQSQLQNDITKRIIARKTAKRLFKNLKKPVPFTQEEIDFYYMNYQASDLTNLHFNRTSNFSPYVLTPDDNLAFCFSISPTISPKLFKHSCQIKAGKVKFTLHGYMKKNNKKFQDDTNLKNLNQLNLNTVIIGDNSIVSDNYNNLGYLTEYIDTFNDRIFNNTVFQHFTDTDPNIPQNIPSNTNYRRVIGSKIRTGNAYSTYVKLENNPFFFLNEVTRKIEKFEEYIFDDFKTHTQIFDLILKFLIDNQNGSDVNIYKAYEIAKELTFYKDKTQQNVLFSNATTSNIFNLITDTTNLIPDVTPPITYKAKFDEIVTALTQSSPNSNAAAIKILAFFVFAAFLTQTSFSSIARIGHKRYLNSFVKLKGYGQFRDNFEQRLYTSLINANGDYSYVVEQKFINDVDGTELTNLGNSLIPHNKSKTLQLIDAGFKSITSNGVITPWNGEDFYNRRHVVYNDMITV
jgi:hypothetical protein